MALAIHTVRATSIRWSSQPEARLPAAIITEAQTLSRPKSNCRYFDAPTA